MVEQLSGRLDELREVLGRVETTVPTREQLAAVNDRLGRLEQSFDRVSEQVTTIEASTPEVLALGERFQELRELVSSTSKSLEASGERASSVLSSNLSQTLGTRIDELECAMRDGIRRWESDQSEVSERLGNLRDSLRDQLREFSSQVEGAQGSLWGKLTGKKDPGLKLSGDEFDALSDKLEGVITGIENVISKHKDAPAGAAGSAGSAGSAGAAGSAETEKNDSPQSES
jgi:chromosome segregation ATPase